MTPLNRILLVDDDAVTNMIHRRVIGKSGCALAVDVATDGAQALDMLRADLAAGRALPELVFLDVNMPCMGGFEFLEQYEGLSVPANAQLVVLTLSISLLPADHARAQAAACVYSLCDKPLREDAVAELVEAFQKQKQLAIPAVVSPRKRLETSGAKLHQDRPSSQVGQGPPDWSRHAR